MASIDFNTLLSGNRFANLEKGGFFGQTWGAWAVFFALALTVLIFTSSVDAWIRREV